MATLAAAALPLPLGSGVLAGAEPPEEPAEEPLPVLGVPAAAVVGAAVVAPAEAEDAAAARC
ncbi:MAG TPA: hypothetical protein VL422_03145, partial [Miltoncostaea sp.]|nr:hypothetical protein [Miltoncostaea sp.]